jgi:hypothetical protein
MPLVEPRDEARGLPRRKTITQIEVGGFSHDCTISTRRGFRQVPGESD